MVLAFYNLIMTMGYWPLVLLLWHRQSSGKEEASRLNERIGQPGFPRPPGRLIWLHAASVGEAQSILALADALLARTNAFLLITTGTVNSARLLAQRLPPRALHQYFPVDRPAWVRRFLDHWQPDLMLWTESELWPSMLVQARQRAIPAALVNGRLSERSFRRWRLAKPAIRQLLGTFSLTLVQTDLDRDRFAALGGVNVQTAGNLKYSAAPLPADAQAVTNFHSLIGHRPVWLFASTHAGEEMLAARIHRALRPKLPGLLTIIVPRHPHRADGIVDTIAALDLSIRRRTDAKIPPALSDDLYLGDTIGELGLFYRVAPVACIGRSFSDDGGGGHNPLEAAQLGCAVLHGPAVQNLAAIYKAMDDAGAALEIRDKAALGETLLHLLSNPERMRAQQEKGTAFMKAQAAVLDTVLGALTPMLSAAGLQDT